MWGGFEYGRRDTKIAKFETLGAYFDSLLASPVEYRCHL